MWIEASDSQFVNIHDIVFRDYFQEKTVLLQRFESWLFSIYESMWYIL